ncbi:PDZ domain-containing protein [Ligilactobacillus ceti]|nr:PDZ domain-containing protein [Ligilactobacillus ceti]
MMIGLTILEFGLGLIMLFGVYQRRLKAERKFFKFAVNNDFYESRYFIKIALLGCLIGSVITGLLGLGVYPEWIFLYEVLSIVALLFISVSEWSLWALVLASLLTLITHWFDLSWLPYSYQYLVPIFSGHFVTGLLGLTFLYYVVKSLLLKKTNLLNLSPRITKGKRGRRVAYYRWQEFTVVPLLVFVPGDLINHFTNWWPILKLPGTDLGIFILPLFVGGLLKIKKEFPQVLLHKYYQHQTRMALLMLIATIVSYFIPQKMLFASCVFGGVLLLEIYAYIKNQRQDQKAARWFVETKQGVRVIAVKAETPAAKMGLQPGDTIMTCNKIPVNSENELYAALQTDPVYCHLKVRTYAGDDKITESAIFADSPHEIGLLLFRDEM